MVRPIRGRSSETTIAVFEFEIVQEYLETVESDVCKINKLSFDPQKNSQHRLSGLHT